MAGWTESPSSKNWEPDTMTKILFSPEARNDLVEISKGNFPGAQKNN